MFGIEVVGMPQAVLNFDCVMSSGCTKSQYVESDFDFRNRL